MSTAVKDAVSAPHSEAENLTEMGRKLAFTKRLQAVTNRIHSSRNTDEIMLEASQDICALFEVDRLTIYVCNEDKTAIVSKVKTGLDSFKSLMLPISPSSIAGFAAQNKQLLNIADVYDTEELKKYSPELHLLKEVDEKTGYRTKQMLVCPIIDQEGGEFLGVVQMINALSGLPFPASAAEGAMELAKTLAIAFKQRARPASAVRTKFDYLVAENILSAGELDLATRAARKKDKPLEEVLMDEFQVKLDAIGKGLAAFYGVPYEPFKPDRIKPLDILKTLKRDYVEANLWLALEELGNDIVILTPDPEKIAGSRIVNHVYPKHKISYRVCTAREFARTIDQFYGESTSSASVSDMLADMDDEGRDGIVIIDETADSAQENELVKLVNKIIVDAYNQGVSDIHVEPYGKKGKTEIRFRKDGSLMPYLEVPPSYRLALVARLKIMCDLDIAEKRKPQDGKIQFRKFGPLDIELRVATVPTAGGNEDVVMRILAAGEPLPLDKLGLSERNLKSLKDVTSKPYGLFFVCGPTGSGKTTTLHSVLKFLNRSDTKIWTAEDPVEITQKGLRQVQMNPKAGLTFAVAMRAFLRADPDVIMVGEMRDKETVSTGIEASLTGHLVLSTLHTNSAPESIIRLLDMGMDPFNFSDALLGVLAQRLAKRLCSKCKKPYTPAAEEIKSMLTEYCEEMSHMPEWEGKTKELHEKIYQEWVKSFVDSKGQFTFYKPAGCPDCNNTGYRGRVGLHELLVGSDAVKKNIQEHARVSEMVVTALSQGMRTLKQDGMEKAIQGVTDMYQVRAVCIK